MVNLFELAAKITLDKKDFDSGLKESEGRMSKFGAGISKALKATVAVSGAAVAAGAAAFAKITGSALNAVGDLEQGLGGSEAVFGEWAEFIKDQANSAAESLGLSATEYLATANKMGSLLQGVGYSQMDAAKLASDAMQRAADVASIMGIDVSAAMESITGAMKGNFQMMDNLGVAINDTTLKAYAASKGMQKSAIDNLTTQQKVGLALELFMSKSEYAMGNYAKENDTLAGSMTTLKAAWNNFLSGAGGENAPEILGRSIDRTADIVVKSLSDIVPRLSKGLSKVLSTVGTKMPQLMETLMPGIETGAGALIDMLGDALPYLLQTAVNLVPSVVSGLGKVFTKVAQKAPEMLKSLWSGLKNAGKQIGGMIFGMDGDNVKWPTWEDVKGYAAAAWDGIKNGVKNIGSWAGKLIFGEDENGEVKWPTWDDVKNAAAAAWDKIKEGASTLGGLIFGKTGDGKVNWPTWKEVGEKAREAWNGIVAEAAKLTGLIFGDTDSAGINLDGLKEKWLSLKQTVENNAVDFLSGLTGANEEDVRNVLTGITEILGNIITLPAQIVENWGSIQGFFTDMWTAISTEVTNAWNAVSQWFVSKYDAIASAWQSVSEFFTSIWNGVKSVIDNAFSAVNSWLDANTPAAIKNAWADIKGFFVDIWDGITGAVNSAIAAIQNFLGLNAQAQEQKFTVGDQEYADPLGATNGLTGDQLSELSNWYSGSHAKGLGYVPYDGYRSILHRGEMVLNRSRADAYRNGQAGFDVSAFMNQMFSVVKGAMEAANISMNMDGQKVAQNTSERQSADEMAWRFAIG